MPPSARRPKIFTHETVRDRPLHTLRKADDLCDPIPFPSAAVSGSLYMPYMKGKRGAEV